jgi:ABC-type dipeptide/oligopeptide/nickel transport system permease subunit
MASSTPASLTPEPEARRGFAAYLLRERRYVALLAAAILVAFALAALLVPLFFSWEVATRVQLGTALLPPAPGRWLGTDELGRDLLARVLWGARITLVVAVCSVAIALVAGLVIGGLCGFYTGKVSGLTMRFIDFMLAFPRTLFAIMLIAVVGNSIFSLTLAIGISTIPIFVRLFQAPVLALKQREFVVASRAMGASDLRLLATHILPNMTSLVIVQSTISLAEAILIGSGLSFLGLGPPPPTPEWGVMIAGSRAHIESNPHVILAPGCALFLVILSFNLVGDALRDFADPRSHART